MQSFVCSGVGLLMYVPVWTQGVEIGTHLKKIKYVSDADRVDGTEIYV